MSKTMTKLLELPFDQYSRQSQAGRLVDRLRKKDTSFSILDVGGYKGVTAQFHPNDRVTILDVFDINEPDYIKGDATNMSFEDNSYDFVVSFDVFEHIPRDKRNAFISECTRVARIGVIVAAPSGTGTNIEAEKRLNDIFKSIYQKDHPWLIEHIEYVLPEPGLAAKLLDENGLQTIELPSNYTPLWVLMQAVIFGASKFEQLGKRITSLYKLYNSTFAFDGSKTGYENYRTIAVGLKNTKDADRIMKDNAKSISDAEFYAASMELVHAVSAAFVESFDELYEQDKSNTKKLRQTQAKLTATEADIQNIRKQLTAVATELDLIRGSKAYRYPRKAIDGLYTVKNIMKIHRKG